MTTSDLDELEACVRRDAEHSEILTAISPRIVLALISRVRDAGYVLSAEREAHAETRRDLFAERERDAEMGVRRGAANAVLAVEGDALREERDAATARAEAAEREAERLRHGLAIGGDHVCPNAAALADVTRERDEARAACVAMREAMIIRGGSGSLDTCRHCLAQWSHDGPEQHDPHCETDTPFVAPLLADLARLRAIETAAQEYARSLSGADMDWLLMALDRKAGS